MVAGLFLGGAGLAMALYAAGELMGLSLNDSNRWVALAGIPVLLAGDLWAIARGSWYPLTLRRQTRKTLMYTMRRDLDIGLWWGLDAGFAVGTYRMTSGIWLVSWLAALNMVSEYVIFGYTFGFAAALIAVVVWPVPGSSVEARAEAASARVDRLIGRGKLVRIIYASMLVLTATVIAGLPA